MLDQDVLSRFREHAKERELLVATLAMWADVEAQGYDPEEVEAFTLEESRWAPKQRKAIQVNLIRQLPHPNYRDWKREHVRSLLEVQGLDLTDPNTKETPDRICRMYDEVFCNVGEEFGEVKSFPNDGGYDQIIDFSFLHFSSTCSHHFLPFTGYAWLLYVPDEIVVGASKPARILEHYSKRPQLQETLAHDVLQCFVSAIRPLGAMVTIRAHHECMGCRGVKQYESSMGTNALYGNFKENLATRTEALSIITQSILMKKLL